MINNIDFNKFSLQMILKLYTATQGELIIVIQKMKMKSRVVRSVNFLTERIVRGRDCVAQGAVSPYLAVMRRGNPSPPLLPSILSP